MAPNGTNTAAPAASGDHMLTGAVTIQVNVFIFGLIGLIILFRLPGLIGFLRSNSGRPFLQTFGRNPPTPGNGGMTSNPVSAVSSLDLDYSQKTEKKIVVHDVHRPSYPGSQCPPHVPSTPKLLDPLLKLLHARVVPGYSALQIAILMNYTYILLYGAFRMSNPFTDNTRSAWLSVSQLPLIFALAQKSSILGTLLGYGYETLNYVHRYAGRLSILAGNIHSIYYIYKWTNAGTFIANISRPENAWGLVLLLAMDLLYVFSTEFWRRKAYNVFFWTHTIGVIVLFPAACLHRPALQPYAFACVGLYGLDRLLRAFKSSIATAKVTALPEMDMACLEIPTIISGWRAGQHVRLRILSGRMGLFGWAETHPFTIASAAGANDGLVLLCKRAGDWTGRLVDLSKELDSKVEGQGRLKVWIEGPFGGPSRMVFASFSAAVLIVGGSGITFGLSTVEELLAKDHNNQSRLKYIELVWVVPNPGSMSPLVPLFTSLIQQSESTVLKISVYYTRALTERVPVFEKMNATPCTPVAIFHPNLTLSPGRPNFKSILNKAVDSALGVSTVTGKDAFWVSGLAVGICGPLSLGEQVVKSVGDIDSATRYRVGGVEVHEE
ncbi:ferric reductase transmembrane component [Ephemerocybe angulata]|uniref:ferric-chelate reductase (NADPH) n=1 Tax=Ephemerocybe angulata TaxID=980116 RepID=A0A8H6MDZ5_9AGAR|nr:ferric reductase transmembrane component [Tulosesus angulatus]